jgi:hypothetical protein
MVYVSAQGTDAQRGTGDPYVILIDTPSLFQRLCDLVYSLFFSAHYPSPAEVRLASLKMATAMGPPGAVDGKKKTALAPRRTLSEVLVFIEVRCLPPLQESL